MTAATPTTFSGLINARLAQVFAALAVLITVVAIAPLYKREIVQAVRAWIDSPTYNHCFLIIPITLYLVWSRRDAIAGMVPRPKLPGVLTIVVCALLWCIAAMLDVIEARQFLFVGIVQGICFTLLGSRLYLRLLGPLLYLFFLVPSGEFLVPKLQDLTAQLAISGLQLVGVPVYSDGIFIQIPEGSFVVAEACAGLRFLVASMAYGVLFALLMYSSWWRRLGFVILSVVVPVVANGIRAFGIIFAAHLIGSASAAEADHIIYGWLFFSIVIFLLTLTGMSFTDRPVRPFAGSSSALRGVAAKPKILVTAAALSALAGVAAPTLLVFFNGSAVSAEAAWFDIPPPLPPWQPALSAPQWRPAVSGADREFLDNFTNGQGRVERYVALLISHGDNNIMRNLGRPAADATPWERANIKRAQARIGDSLQDIEVSEIRSEDGRRRLVWSFYIVDGKAVASALRAKLLEAYASLTGGGRAIAYVAVSTPIDNSAIDRQAELQEFLGAMTSLDSYIAAIK
jgi:exosortase A